MIAGPTLSPPQPQNVSKPWAERDTPSKKRTAPDTRASPGPFSAKATSQEHEFAVGTPVELYHEQGKIWQPGFNARIPLDCERIKSGLFIET